MNWLSTYGSERRRLLGVGLVVAGLAAAGCTRGPVEDDFERTVEYFPVSDRESAPVRDQLLDDLERADTEIRAAISDSTMNDQRLIDSLREAHDRGVEVQVVADVDDRSSQAFEPLRDGDVPTTYGDGQVQYLPNPNLAQVADSCEMKPKRRVVVCNQQAGSTPCQKGGSSSSNPSICRPSTFNDMSHDFFVIDEQTIWNLAGHVDGQTVAWRAESEVLHEDFFREHRQLDGGVFATNLDTYNGPNKSRTDDTVRYHTDEGVMRLRFNPQERLMKQVVDAAYAAKSSVQIVTPSLTNPFLLDALEYKVDNGFDVEIVVGSTQPEAGPARDRLVDLGAKQIDAGRELPTLVILDDRETGGGEQWPRDAMVLSHPLWHAQPLSVRQPPPDSNDPERADRVIVYPSDQFVDGNLWTLFETSTNAHEVEEIDPLVSLASRLARDATDLQP